MANETKEVPFNRDARRAELIARFQSLASDQARREIGVLPYYHAVENAITKPNQGTFVTRYFRTKWRPALGNEASEIVLAIRFLADKETGETFAGYDTIAALASLSVRCVERWLSHIPPKNRSGAWLARWRLLHTFFILGKRKQYVPVILGNRTEYRRHTNRIRIAMDDPVHPDDEGALFAEAAQRIANDEMAQQNGQESSNRPVDGYGHVPYRIEVDSSSPNRPLDGYLAPTSGRRISSSYRSNLVNVKEDQSTKDHKPSTSSAFSHDPRVRDLSPQQRERYDRLVAEIGAKLLEKEPYLATATGRHQSEGFHRRAVYFLGDTLVRRALMDLSDRLADAREGRKTLVSSPSRLFGAFLRRIAQQQRIDLHPKSSLLSQNHRGLPSSAAFPGSPSAKA
jgi:hypothetical protein